VRIIAIPVKSLAKSKSRLAPVLSPRERAALTLAMLEDVLDAALSISTWETWVVSRDEAVLEIAARRRARPVPEEKPPLSAAVRQVEDEAERQDAAALAVLLGDLPLLTTRELTGALRTLGPVVAAPSTERDGTNLLVRRPPRVMPGRFGKDSFRKHREGAAARGLPMTVTETPGLVFDVDVPADLARLLQAENGGRTWQTCRELDLAGRLAVRT
jgi:2-phospho-L-lactate guanylyltransferase